MMTETEAKTWWQTMQAREAARSATRRADGNETQGVYYTIAGGPGRAIGGARRFTKAM